VARTPIPVAERYRRKAQKLRALAESMMDAEAKAALLRTADGYDEMARSAAAATDRKPEPDRSK
jgi:hypothetical protein